MTTEPTQIHEKTENFAAVVAVWDLSQAVPSEFWGWVEQASSSTEQLIWIKDAIRHATGARWFGVLSNGYEIRAFANHDDPTSTLNSLAKEWRRWWRKEVSRDDLPVPKLKIIEWSQIDPELLKY